MSAWVLDASVGGDGHAVGLFCFCPVEGDFPEGEYSIITGMNVISDAPPHGGKLVAIIHEDGQEAVERFCQEYAPQLASLQAKLESKDAAQTAP